jgi:hypothetical protein
VALIGALAVTGTCIAPSSAEQLDPSPQPTGKTWSAFLSTEAEDPLYPYVPVLDVRTPDQAANLDDPKLSWYYLPEVTTWEVDCKYKHPTMGWMYRGTKITKIPNSGGQVDGYYEMGYKYTKLDNKLKLADVDELCFPDGDTPA